MKENMSREKVNTEKVNKEGETPYSNWREGLVSGNGRLGVIWTGQPDSEVFIFQNMDFIMPTPHPRHTREGMEKELESARQSVLHLDAGWSPAGKRTYMYPFHPGEQLRMEAGAGEQGEEGRWTDYETGEIKGRRESSFVSFADDVVVTRLLGAEDGSGLSVRFSLDDLSRLPKYGQWKHGTAPETMMKYCKFADDKKKIIGLLAHYPAFVGSELAESGYLVISKLVQAGGSCSVSWHEDKESIRLGNSPTLEVCGAGELCILTRTILLRDFGSMESFCAEEGIKLREGIVAAYEEQLEELTEKYADGEGVFSYEAALAASMRRRAQLFGKVSIWLGDGETEKKVVQVYTQGRYALECCSGYSVPRLCGIWTGEFNPAWAGAYTMDANVNIQLSGMNVGNMYGTGKGYVYFVLRQLADWKQNAKAVYGMEEALLIPVNTDGARAMLVESDRAYPFQYWNAGASWMLVPLYEFWQCFGNQEIELPEDLRKLYQKESLDLEREILTPLLHAVLSFWRQLCTPRYYVDSMGKMRYDDEKTKLETGEHYLLIPSYSPENKPVGYGSCLTANATMDIAAARDCLNMVIRYEKYRGAEESENIIGECRELLSDLPEYLYDETGALQEWALREFRDNNEHRHMSHLYCAWPGNEAQHMEGLKEACMQALRNREEANRGRDDESSHGWIHRALVAARLKDGAGAGKILRHIFSSDIFYSTLMTDHDLTKARGVYCTDTVIGLVGVIQELLLYSDDEEITFLPALPPEWKQGRVCGLRTRNGVLVQELCWDMNGHNMRVELEADRSVEVKLSCGAMEKLFPGNSIHLEKGKRIQLCRN